MKSKPQKKELKVHGHEGCPECINFGYNIACSDWESYTNDSLNPCLCPKSEAKTVKRITSQIWQCPRCGGLIV